MKFQLNRPILLLFIISVSFLSVASAYKHSPFSKFDVSLRNRWNSRLISLSSSSSSSSDRTRLRLDSYSKDIEYFQTRDIIRNDENYSKKILRQCYRVSWVSFWLQLTLTIMAGTTLVFANSLRYHSNWTSLWLSGFPFSVIGELLAMAGCFWSWNCTRYCRRSFTSKEDVISSLQKYSQIGLQISVGGMLSSLLGAKLLGTSLAAKLLTSQALNGVIVHQPALKAISTSSIEALDIYLMQANTNNLLANFVALLSCLWLLRTLSSTATATTTIPSSSQHQQHVLLS